MSKESEEIISLFGKVENFKTSEYWTTGLTEIIQLFAWAHKKLLGQSEISLIDYSSKIILQEFIHGFIEKNIIPSINTKDAAKLLEIDIDEQDSEDEDKIINLIISKIVEEFKLVLKKIKSAHKNQKYKAASRYSPTSGMKEFQTYSSLEVQRRLVYFDEEYLNAEFDVFMSLVSDKFLSYFYYRLLDINFAEQWSSFGGGNLTYASLDYNKSYIDNVVYNSLDRIIIGNELKHNGAKNGDQILKYVHWFENAKVKEYINEDSTYILIFIDWKVDEVDTQKMIKEEIEYCERKTLKYRNRKKGSKDGKDLSFLLDQKIISEAYKMRIKFISWNTVIEILSDYLLNNSQLHQTEQKLITGMVNCLQNKYKGEN
jgi:hypothetical protein